MNQFRVDFHVHSRFSRATSGKLSIRHLAAWSLVKGLSVMATGDFTHPAWREELRRDLLFDEASGLYRTREPTPVETELTGFSRPAETQEPLFLIQAEVSSIYKKNGAVRKVHNLIFMPDLESADRLSAKLAAIGNITSDGRPILGLDCEHLLEMVLESSDRGVLVPAHIWTPWFSLFGSKSGFDTLEACFGSLSSHVFALETGLSSDPDMNRLWSHLDPYALISNSDAHSGENLGREANLFSGTPTYDGLFAALRHSAGRIPNPHESCSFRGTMEFFPEEGKYHLDGHRACAVVLDPDDSRKLGDLCPVCGKPLTVGVLHRVKDLADRETPLFPEFDPGYVSLVPLPEIIGELLGVGPKSRKVQLKQAELVRLFGSELDILHQVPESDLRQHWDALGEGISRMRRGAVIREGGYDGEYGVVRLFAPDERKEVTTRRKTFTGLLDETHASETASPAPIIRKARQKTPSPTPAPFTWSAAQDHAIHAGPHPVLVFAGPGSGKTRTLVGRVCRLLTQGVSPDSILAVTFTRRAAGEMRERLQRALSGTAAPSASLPCIDTLHALGLAQWSLRAAAQGQPAPGILSEEAARSVFLRCNPELTGAAARKVWDQVSLARERLDITPELQSYLDRYTTCKQQQGCADYTDLLEVWLQHLQTGEHPAGWSEILVDEIQDFSPLQIALVRALCASRTEEHCSGAGFFGIGDPDQSIYGFRGAHPDIPGALAGVWSNLETITLADSHRSAAGILTSASTLLGTTAVCGHLVPTRTVTAALHLFSAPDAQREAGWIADQAARLIGGTSHTLLDAKSRKNKAPSESYDALSGTCSPGDIAILVRYKALIPPLQAALERRGIPCAVPEAAPFWSDTVVSRLLAIASAAFGKPYTHLDDAPDMPAVTVPDEVWKGDPEQLLTCLATNPQSTPLDVTMIRDSSAYRALIRAFKAQGTWEQLLDWVALRQEFDLVRQEAEYVQIMTLHAAKGLEFRAVFLPCLEQGIMPSFGIDALLQAEATSDAVPRTLLDEERRLLYVGLTRACDALFISHAAQRTIYGKTIHCVPSEFLTVLPDLFHRSKLVRHTQTTTTHMSLLG